MPKRSDELFDHTGIQPLGQLIRRIIGLDRRAAKAAFGEFLESGTFNADQIRFIDQIVEHLARNGVMDVGVLYEPPFTDMHSQGLDGILPEHADKIVSIIQHVNTNADAAA
jgi:type I restriction enzyme R subunit